MPPLDPATFCDPDPRDEARNARHLSKYVFPLQYRLSNVFISQLPAKANYKQPDLTDREREIQVRQGLACEGTWTLLGTCKTPKRLKDVLGLLEKMIWRHGKCHYKLLRDKVCPSKVSSLNDHMH
ncbi:hypothetical protein BDR05DRAFT_895686 [Suillus weaverae]|nr:hypothetical protein BDR05DRAFT_895686 [Suillus weaverae]